MIINKDVAREVFRDAANADPSDAPKDWVAKVEELSAICAAGKARTHIAFLGISILARASDAQADLFAIKPEHAPDNPKAYSARSLSETVLVPLAVELGVNLGVTGKQPLNNMPYFRMKALDDGTPVHKGSRAGFDFMVSLVRELQDATVAEARGALRAFIAVRRQHRVSYASHDGDGISSPSQLAEAIAALVGDDSEGGKRAQAVAAGIFDVVFGPQCVESGRINDPSRHYPGDVCVRAEEGADNWTRAVEVRDKPVSASDVQIFATRCAQSGVREAAVLMVAERQTPLDDSALQRWADEIGIGLTLFYGWATLVDQALFWAADAKPDAAAVAVGTIRGRLIAVEASPEAVEMWADLTSADGEVLDQTGRPEERSKASGGRG